MNPHRKVYREYEKGYDEDYVESLTSKLLAKTKHNAHKYAWVQMKYFTKII